MAHSLPAECIVHNTPATLASLGTIFDVYSAKCCSRVAKHEGKCCDYILGKQDLILLVETKSRTRSKIKQQLEGCMEIASRLLKASADIIPCCIAKRDRYIMDAKEPPKIKTCKTVLLANSAQELIKKLKTIRPKSLQA